MRCYPKNSKLIAGQSSQPKATKLRNIRDNHAKEKALQRNKEAFVIKEEINPAKVIPLNSKANIGSNQDKAYEDQMDMIAKILEEDEDNHDGNT